MGSGPSRAFPRHLLAHQLMCAWQEWHLRGVLYCKPQPQCAQRGTRWKGAALPPFYSATDHTMLAFGTSRQGVETSCRRQPGGASRAGAAAHPFLAVIDNGIPLQMPHPHMPALSTGATPSALAANGHFALQRSSSPARQPRCIEGGPCYTATGLPRAWQPHQCRGSMAVARRGNRNAGRGCGVGAANWLATLHMPAPLQKGG